MQNSAWNHEMTSAGLYSSLRILGRADVHPSFWVQLKSFVSNPSQANVQHVLKSFHSSNESSIVFSSYIYVEHCLFISLYLDLGSDTNFKCPTQNKISSSFQYFVLQIKTKSVHFVSKLSFQEMEEEHFCYQKTLAC